MPNLSVCIEMFWPDESVAARVYHVAEAGYRAFEFWNSSDKDLDVLRAAQAATGLAVAALVAEPGFALTRFGNDEEQIAGLRRSAAVAHTLGCSSLIVTTGNSVAGEPTEATRRRVVRKLQKLAAVAAAEGMTLCLEPLNPFVDHPGYWLTTMAQAADIVLEVDSPQLKILYDLYHQQVTEGKLIDNLRRYIDLIGHIHVAQAPGRGQLAGGEIDYAAVFTAIDAVGYRGYVGLEFRPTIAASAALRQARDLCGL